MITDLTIGHRGQFGNQIFELSALFALSMHLDTPIKIPIENVYKVIYKCKPWEAHFELFNCFDLPQNILTPRESIQPQHYYKQPFYHFDPAFWEIQKDTAIEGYFQSEKYFSKYRNELLSFLRFHPAIKTIAQRIVNEIGKNELETVGIHVRRGDHVSHSIDLKADYYQRAIDRFNEWGTFNFIVVSDDVEWCKEIFKGVDRLHILEDTGNYVDLCVLTLCNHSVICNSTFGWWGSWLNQLPDRVVIAPTVWCPPTDLCKRQDFNFEDLYCKDWFLI